MYDGKKLLALVPARGGSKSIKNKNIINLAGKPLIAYTIEAALNSQYIDQTIVTTDSQRIADIAQSYGASVPFLRPPELAQDTSKTVDVVLHAVDSLRTIGMQFDLLVLLQPTQPLRTSNDIDNAIQQYYSNGELPLASVSPVNDSPLLIRTINTMNRLVPLLNENSTCRRQDMKKYYRVNGCIYINSIYTLTQETSFNDNLVPFVMPKEHSVDIDEMSDLAMAEYYLRNKICER